MHSDRTLINKRNVTVDVSKKVDACKQLFHLELQAHVVAAALQVLEIKSVEEEPREDLLPENLSQSSDKEKRLFINCLSEKIVDKFLLHGDLNEIFQKQNYEDWLRTCNPVTEDGHYKCRLATCSKTFGFDGKQRKDHERTAWVPQPFSYY